MMAPEFDTCDVGGIMKLPSGFIAGALLLFWISPARAQDFAACDGFPDPGKKSDGIVKGTMLWGLVSTSADIRQQSDPAFGEKGIAACDAALANPLLKPDFVVRRIHLLQLKALHQIAAGKTDVALVTLDAAQAIPLEPAGLRAKGLGLAAMALRALALSALDRHDQARALIGEVAAARPYAPSVQRLAGLLISHNDPSIEAEFADLHHRQALDPMASLRGMIHALLAGRNDEVVALSNGLTFDLPRMRGGWTLEGGGDEYALISVRAGIAGLRAYSLAALGRDTDAAQTIAAARADLAEAKAPPQAKPGSSPSKNAMHEFEARKAKAESGEGELAISEQLIALRRKAKSMNAEQFFAELERIDRSKVPSELDLLTNLTAIPADEVHARDTAIAQLRTEVEMQRRKDAKFDFSAFAQALPAAETASNQPSFHGAGDGYFLSDSGYSTKQMDDPAK